MMKINQDFKVSKNFMVSEFACNGDDSVILNYVLINKIQELRKILGCPVIINSGYRTPEYNKKVGGSSISQHMLGKAVDISTRNLDIDDETLIRICKNLGFTGIGIYDTWIHVDVRDNPDAMGYTYWDNRNK